MDEHCSVICSLLLFDALPLTQGYFNYPIADIVEKDLMMKFIALLI